MQASVLDLVLVNDVCDGCLVRNCMIAPLLTRGCLMSSRVMPRTFMLTATGRSTPATDTDGREDTACSWCVILMSSTSDLSRFSWSPFCMYHCLISMVHVARTDKPSAVFMVHITRWSLACLVAGKTVWFLVKCLSAYKVLHKWHFSCLCEELKPSSTVQC